MGDNAVEDVNYIVSAEEEGINITQSQQMRLKQLWTSCFMDALH